MNECIAYNNNNKNDWNGVLDTDYIKDIGKKLDEGQINEEMFNLLFSSFLYNSFLFKIQDKIEHSFLKILSK